jgi:hypothetical protein
MKIWRNGFECELTYSEMRKVYEKMKEEYLREDIECRARENGVELSKASIEYAVNRVDKCLHNNDCYWDIYWGTIDIIIEEALED